jgi:cyclic pyranopterin phosphate synthase
MSKLTHLDEKGRARMVDVSAKDITLREATARGRITMMPETLAIITEGRAKKGDVLAAARIAGIMAAKKTHELIPLCHPLTISGVTVDFVPDSAANAIEVAATVKVEGKTGVAIDRAMRIGDIRLTEKSGGKSGHYSGD